MPANIANQPKCSAASSGDFETNVQAVADQLGDHFEAHALFGDGGAQRESEQIMA